MRIAILGATSQIARDLVVSFSMLEDKRLHLFARRPDEVVKWLNQTDLTGRYPVGEFADFPKCQFDAVINFVGVGNPARAVAMGNAIFDVTLRFDEMVLDYLKQNPKCRYLFLSSGAVYGSNFNQPVSLASSAVMAINNPAPHEWYGVAKLHAEYRHRANPELPIVDIRVFNYFSRTQDISARFLISDMVRAIRDKSVMRTSPDRIVRDFLHPSDFYRLVEAVLSAPPANTAVDCYSRAPVDKWDLLEEMQKQFGLRFEVSDIDVSVNATGSKQNYYSLNNRAANFGYYPTLTSLEGVLQEAGEILRFPLQVNVR